MTSTTTTTLPQLRAALAAAEEHKHTIEHASFEYWQREIGPTNAEIRLLRGEIKKMEDGG